jgi:hypothetical protein
MRRYTRTMTKMTHGMANRITSWTGLTFTKFSVIKIVRTPHTASKLPAHWMILVEPGDNPNPEPSIELKRSVDTKNIPEFKRRAWNALSPTAELLNAVKKMTRNTVR